MRTHVYVSVYICNVREKEQQQKIVTHFLQLLIGRTLDIQTIKVETTSSQSCVLPSPRKKDPREFPRDRVQLKEILAHSKLVILHKALALNILNSGKWDRVAVKMLKGLWDTVVAILLS